MNGDLSTMEGLCQKHYRHSVPADLSVTQPRINLTWRWIVDHCDDGCPLNTEFKEFQKMLRNPEHHTPEYIKFLKSKRR
jgi:epoxyqueuosine reductase QueG